MITPPRYLTGFALARLPHLDTDTVVLGTGVAGMQAARAAAAAGNDVLLICKQAWDDSDTALAQGGIAVVLDAADSVEAHVEDTLAAGAGLCDRARVELMVREGIDRTRDLVAEGLRLDTGADGELHHAREGAHRLGRVVHIGGDATGRGLAAFLHARVQQQPRIRLLEHVCAVDLLTADGFCRGVLVLDIRSGNLLAVRAAATVIATGGVQRLYRESTAVEGITGDGVAMAYRAGATVQDMEFMQFHPTALYVAGAPRFLLSEALRGEGGILRNRAGAAFMARYDARAELAPRDIVTRAIIDEMAARGDTNVLLDVTALGRPTLWARFPTIARQCQLYGIDIAQQPIPVRPAAHYFMGGIVTDEFGRTQLPGLLACGEAASTGVHGANRLASNSLLEGLVYGWRAGMAAGEYARQAQLPPWPRFDAPTAAAGGRALNLADMRNALQSLLWRKAGIFRDGAALAEAEDMIGFWSEYVFPEPLTGRDGFELKNALTVAALIVHAARARTESRGAHFRRDCPPPADPAWARHLTWRRAE